MEARLCATMPHAARVVTVVVSRLKGLAVSVWNNALERYDLHGSSFALRVCPNLKSL